MPQRKLLGRRAAPLLPGHGFLHAAEGCVSQLESSMLPPSVATTLPDTGPDGVPHQSFSAVTLYPIVSRS